MKVKISMSSSESKTVLIEHCEQIVQVVSNGERYVRGGSEKMKKISILTRKESDNLAIVSIGGVLKFVGYQSEEVYQEHFKPLKFTEVIDATGCCIIPGLVDSHTHPVWEGDRISEFKMKLEGADYMQIHEAGGGIHYTVSQTKAASEETLFNSFHERLDSFTASGTTFIECKSGYGLEWETELKQMHVLTKAKRTIKSIGITNTYLGGHAIPKGKTSDEATNDIVNNQIPKLIELIKKKELDIDNIDVFCEKGVYDVEQTKRILEKSNSLYDLNINFHSDEIYPLNSVELGVNMKAKGVSHLEEISDHEIELLSKSETVGVLLPTTAIIIPLPRPPARKMLDSGCIISLGSDFNPNAYCFAMPVIMNLACVDLRLSMNEALVAATLNSAFSLGVESTRGSIEVGKNADLVILKTNRWENIIYQMGAHSRLIRQVMVDGNVVFHARL